MEVEPFAKPPVWVTKAVEEEAERLAAFAASTLELSWSTGG